MEYQLFKALHLFGVAIFIGNIIVTGLWKALADRTGRAVTIAYAQRLVTLTDWLFTAGGVALILIGGYGMVAAGDLDLGNQTWLVWGQGLFVASGAIWVILLIPIQIKQARLARGFADGSQVPDLYWRLNRLWLFWGVTATVLPIVNFYLMVFKP